jgi:hypothetical protein
MTTETTETNRPRAASTQRAAVGQLARIEGRRMLRHPAPWLGLVLSGLFAYDVVGTEQTWEAAHYQGLTAAATPLLLGISLASMSAFARQRQPVSEDAPVAAPERALARLLGGLPLIGLAAVVVAAVAVWLRVRGGLDLGVEPGHTAHAYYSLSELLQPVLLAGVAVALGAAVVHVVRQRLVAAIVLFVGWFLVGATYWLFNGDVTRWVTPLQVQPVDVEVGPAAANPAGFDSSWLLAPPGEYRDHWARLVVSPSLAGWHDVYLVGLTALLVAVAVPGRTRRPLLAGGALLAVVAVLMQAAVTP